MSAIPVRYPRVASWVFMNRFAYKRYALTAFLIVLTATPQWFVAATTGPALPDPGSVSGATKEQQVQLGLQVMAEVYKQRPGMTDSNPATQYIQRLGNRLVSVIPRKYLWPYQFHVIPQREIN